MNRFVIEMEGITLHKAKNILLDHINLCFSEGEFAGIIGPNGAGKTTLLNVIAGFERFTGRLSLFGQDQTWHRDRNITIRIGYVPQVLEIDRSFPILAYEVVLTGCLGRTGLFRLPEKKEKERSEEVMEMLRIKDMAKKPFGRLSGGEQQKVILARAIIQEPHILLLDEPASNLDMAVQKEFMDLISDIHKKKGMTILLVTHDFNLLPASLRRGILINKGKIVFDGDIRTATSGEVLSALFKYNLETFERNGKRFVSYD
ncbi:MAG TPA: metal ABC transporter ATP-binding protein [Syntrophorhabdaceae bacterium]|nr:metal ABC transporter ATP-binding protein [Syntrophorhabdaceae bacterium]